VGPARSNSIALNVDSGRKASQLARTITFSIQGL
jgi:hypothetical protein